MAMKRCKVGIAVVLCSVLLFWLPPRALACGPYFDQAIFTHQDHPDFPLSLFAQGRIGVIQPTYARSYLVVAYRYLSGVALSPGEQQAAVSVWDERLNHPETTSDNTLKKWTDARARVSGAVPAAVIESVFRPVDQKDNYSEYLNCTQDSFQTAVVTLGRRIDEFGPD